MSNRQFIQKAKLKKGALRKEVSRIHGKKGFTERDTIKVSILRDMSKKRNKQTNRLTKNAKRARFALTLRKLR